MTMNSISMPAVLKWMASIPFRAQAGVATLAVLVVLSCLAPLIAPFSESAIISTESFAYPDNASWLGTDYLGRDLLSRLLFGGSFTLLLALATTVITFLMAVTAGFAAGLMGGLRDEALSRVVDALLSIPSIIFALLVINAFGTTIPVVIGTVALIEACRVFRLARALAIKINSLDYVDAARARGEGLLWIATREVLPNTVAVLATEFGLRFTYIILFISALSFIGLGVQPPTADWGVMVRENAKGLVFGSPAALLPAAMIALVTISVNLIVDALVDRKQAGRTPEMLP
ncbi:ABC transporter permease [Rhizobium sp.]